MKYKTCTDYWLNTKNYSLRGEFDEMYQDIDGPQNGLRRIGSLDNRLFLEIMTERNKYGRIRDIGCGLGGVTDNIRKRFSKEEAII